MKKLICAAAMSALCATVFAIESENIVGYQQISVPNGFSLFTATFKNIGEKKTFDLNSLRPTDPNGNVLSLSDGTLYVCVLDSAGNYSENIRWRGKTLGGWSKDGTTLISDGEVEIGEGVGIAVYNNIKVDSDGNETTKKGGVSAQAKFQVSGEVDLVCKNLVAQGFSITGNSTPSAIDLTAVKPTDLNGKVLNLSDGTVYICLLDAAGNYGENIRWRGKTLGGWSVDGTTVISQGDVVIAAGSGFAVYNNVKADENGNESTGKKATATSIYLSLPSPVK